MGQRTYYVYILSRPSTDKRPNEVFYVGKGTKSRLFQHEKEALDGQQSAKCDVIRDIWLNDGHVQKTVLYQTFIERDALVYEWALINIIYNSSTLTNEKNVKPLLTPRPPISRSTKLWEIRDSLGLTREEVVTRLKGLSTRTYARAEYGQAVTNGTATRIVEAINDLLLEANKPTITLNDLGLVRY